MKKKQSIAALLTLAAVAFLSACTQGGKRELSEGFYALDLPADGKDKNILMSRVAQSVDYIALETTEQCRIENIWKVVPTRDYLVVMDKKSWEHVYLFTREGKFVREIGSKGTREDQYATLGDVTADPENNRVFILDGVRKTILEFSPEDTLLSKTPTLFYVENFQFISGNTLALNPNYNKSKFFGGDTPNLLLMDLENGVTDRGVIRPAALEPSHMIGLRSNFSKIPQGATFVAPLCDTIFLATRTQIRPLYLADFGNDNETKNRQHIRDILENKPAVYSLDKLYEEMDKVFLTGFYAFQDVAMISYRKQTHRYVAFYYPESGKTIVGSSAQPRVAIPVGNDMDGLTVFNPLGGEANRMYCYTTLGLSDNPTALSPEAQAVKDAYKKGDNPVLAVVTLKTE